MTYSTRDDGTGHIELTAEENKAFQRGVGIFRRTADAKGVATICLKLTRPKRRRDRFPEAMGWREEEDSPKPEFDIDLSGPGAPAFRE